MTRVITLDPEQRERMIAILSSILDNEHDKRKMGDDFHLTDDQLVNIEVRYNWLSDFALERKTMLDNVEMIVEDWLASMIVDYAEDYPDILALVAPLDVITEALSRALERYELIGADDEIEAWQESGDSVVNYPLVHEYQLVHNALKALNNHNALIADLKEA
jgi:hypothetical protein